MALTPHVRLVWQTPRLYRFAGLYLDVQFGDFRKRYRIVKAGAR